ncbi:conserved hypothetical protein [Neospora caninum Liverpool]|uniref:Uncharacterized protein n=1 Tax=Neospora caninum (strain Liverpool) TaxID=572307 RepID=F0VCG4_NEOCL|nr:conserved hypothetical protein [Neospora caninum Liverpool]CBZ51286.1 conserved hypothetical protein [Neospora caninum Liverpool]|eukprot:XP_003881319.1 conserved hypothetical protein [Neospora caninum Liverpool]
MNTPSGLTAVIVHRSLRAVTFQGTYAARTVPPLPETEARTAQHHWQNPLPPHTARGGKAAMRVTNFTANKKTFPYRRLACSMQKSQAITIGASPGRLHSQCGTHSARHSRGAVER